MNPLDDTAAIEDQHYEDAKRLETVVKNMWGDEESELR